MTEKIDKWYPTFEWDGDDYNSWEVYEGKIRNDFTDKELYIEDEEDAQTVCNAMNDEIKYRARVAELEAALSETETTLINATGFARNPGGYPAKFVIERLESACIRLATVLKGNAS